MKYRRRRSLDVERRRPPGRCRQASIGIRAVTDGIPHSQYAVSLPSSRRRCRRSRRRPSSCRIKHPGDYALSRAGLDIPMLLRRCRVVSPTCADLGERPRTRRSHLAGASTWNSALRDGSLAMATPDEQRNTTADRTSSTCTASTQALATSGNCAVRCWRAAFTNPVNSGCPSRGVEVNSGWNCVATNHG